MTRWRVRRGPLMWIVASSLGWALCYPPFPLGPLSFVILVPLFAATLRLNRSQAFWHNFLGGLAYNSVMYWWIYNVMKVGPALVIGGGLVLLILFLSFFNALLGWMFRVLYDKPWGPAVFPLLWGGLEVLRSRGEMSFPWNDMGYTLGHWNPLIQASAVLGVFGLSAAVVACNGLAFAAWRAAGARRWTFAGAALAVPLLLGWYGRQTLAAADPDAGTVDIALVQPSIPQTKKWEEGYFQEVMQKTWSTLEKDSTAVSPDLAGSDLVVLAETAVPDFLLLPERADVRKKLLGLSRKYGADFLVGALDFEPDDKPYRANLFFNSAFLFSGRKGDTLEQYSKLRLVPFSERLPFDDILPLLNYVNLGEGDFSPGPGHVLWTAGNARYSPSICYEIIYPDFAREARREGAEMLVNITNDGWFGNSNAPYQHANIARFRAIETGIPVARCSNAGVSVFYDYKGRTLGKTKLFEQTVLRRKLPLTKRDTWYYRHGDAVESALAWLFPLGLLACIGLAWRARTRPA